MEPISLAWAAEVLDARVLGDKSGVVEGICTDTRQETHGFLFFALEGEHSDGHAYVARAFAAGAAGAVVSQEVKDVPGPLLVVPDTLRALGDLAMHYRRQFEIPVVGVTGSVGKTSTKEMIAAVLRTQYRVLASAKNYNNEIGVPMTLFDLTRQHEAAVIEMGMRGLGQIDRLAEIAQPTIGVITNIGFAHIELLGSQEKIAEAKSELLARLPENGIAILPMQSHIIFEYLRERCRCGRVVTFGSESSGQADVFVHSDDGDAAPSSEDGTAKFHVFVGGYESAQADVSLQVVGSHHKQNALAALAVAYALEIPIPQAVAALEVWQGAEGRMVVTHTDDSLTVLDDCYNAGPESMKAALVTLRQIAESRRVAVLGDMRELGDLASEAHRLVGIQVILSEVHELIAVGELAKIIVTGATEFAAQESYPRPSVYHFADSEAAAAGIRGLVQPGDTVLVKGSRAMQMEQIVAALTGREETGAHG